MNNTNRHWNVQINEMCSILMHCYNNSIISILQQYYVKGYDFMVYVIPVYSCFINVLVGYITHNLYRLLSEYVKTYLFLLHI